MEYVYFKNGYAYASDAHVLIKQSLGEYCTVINKEALDGKCLYKDSFKDVRGFDIAEAKEDGIDCSDHDGGRKAFFPYGKEEVYAPNFETILNQISSASVPFIGLNPKLVEIAGKCLVRDKYSAMRLSFQGGDRPIVATIEGFGDQIAIIMPMLLGGNLF